MSASPVQAQLRQCTKTRIDSNFVFLQLNVFSFLEVANKAVFRFVSLAINWPSTGFSLDLEETVNVFSKETILLTVKVPHLEDFHDAVTSVQHLVQLRSTPRACDFSLIVRMITGSLLLILGAGPTEGEGQLFVEARREHR